VVTYQLVGGRALEALGDLTRRAIFERLVARPRSCDELADMLPVSRPAVSQHLKVLKRSGLVSDRAEGTRRFYRVDPAGIAAMREDRFPLARQPHRCDVAAWSVGRHAWTWIGSGN